MVTFLDNAIFFLNKLGVWSVLIPFMFAFTIVFALLQKSKILGKDSVKYNSVLALVFSFLFVYFVDMPSMLYFVFYVVIFAIGSLLLMMLINMLGFKRPTEDKKKKKFRNKVMFVVFSFLIILVGSPFVNWSIVQSVLWNPAVIMLLIFIVVLWFIVGSSKPARQAEQEEQQAPPSEPRRAPQSARHVRTYRPEQGEWQEPRQR
jgi:undecaprenyl pyrophosphate phosphatase UppP